MKTTKLLIFLAIIIGAFALKEKNSRKNKIKFQRKTQKGDWSIESNNTYKVFIFVNSQENYNTCSLKGDAVYPSDKVSGINAIGLTVRCSETKGDFLTTANKSEKDVFQLDYKDTSTFNCNASNSFWGQKGKTISTFYKGKNVTVMFEYGNFGDYITSKDLCLMATHINNKRTERLNKIKSLTLTCKEEASKLKSKNEIVLNLSMPVTSLDQPIKNANDQLVGLEVLKKASEQEVSSLSDLINSIQKQLSEAKNSLDISASALSTAKTNSNLKAEEIYGYNKSKSGNEEARKIQLQEAQSNLQKAKSEFDTCSNKIITTCQTCNSAVNLAVLAFASQPFNRVPVETNINSIYTSGN